MISVDDAIRIILNHPFEYKVEEVEFSSALNRILAEDIVADADLPPFDRVMMDGIAIRSSDYNSGLRQFKITGIQRAGEAQKTLDSEGSCLEVMTGATCPIHSDLIVPYEQLTIADQTAMVNEFSANSGMHIHRMGSDKKKGDLLISKHTLLSTAEIGVAASVGHARIKVASKPRIHIFSTGDELVEVSEQPLRHQIRRSNVFALQAMLHKYGFESTESHLPDEEKSILDSLENILSKNDVVLLTGGVSKGKFDLIPEMLKRLKTEELFHRIAQKPGKPMWFGKNKKTLVFALPGNPVSSVLCASRYLIPWLNSSYHGQIVQQQQVFYEGKMQQHAQLTQFVLVKIRQSENGLLHAEPIIGNGSGDFSSMVGADGFVEIPSLTDHTNKYPLLNFYRM